MSKPLSSPLLPPIASNGCVPSEKLPQKAPASPSLLTEVVFDSWSGDVTRSLVLTSPLRQVISSSCAAASVPVPALLRLIGSCKPEDATKAVEELAGRKIDADPDRANKRTAATQVKTAVQQVMESCHEDLARWQDQKRHVGLLAKVAGIPQLFTITQIPVWTILIFQVGALITCLFAELSSCTNSVRNAGIGFDPDATIGPALFTIVFVVGPAVVFEFAGKCLFARSAHRFWTAVRFVTVPLMIATLFVFTHKMGSAVDAVDPFSANDNFQFPMWLLNLGEMLLLSMIVLILPKWINASRDKLWPQITVTAPDYIHICREERARSRFIAECEALIEAMNGVIRQLDDERAAFVQACLGELHTTRARLRLERRDRQLRLLDGE